MGRRKKGEAPKPRLHKASGRGVVQFGKETTYLDGKHNSPESQAHYRRLLADWLKGQEPTRPSAGCTVRQVVAAFLIHAKNWYVRDDGSPTGEADKFTLCTTPLLARFGALPAADVTADHLAELQAEWVRAGHARKTVNQYVSRIRHVFRWAKKKKLVGAGTVVELESLDDLQAGRTTAPEGEEVQPPPQADVEAARAEMGSAVKAMTLLQELAGMRPGEVCRMKGSEVNTDGEARVGGRLVKAGGWVFAPIWHKNKRRGKPLYYVLGPKAREVLRPWLTTDGYLFPPARRTRNPGTHYTTASYGKAVRRACARAGVPEWGVNRLRHLFLTRADREAGLETASAAVGHSSTNTTAGYVQKRLREAAALAEKIG